MARFRNTLILTGLFAVLLAARPSEPQAETYDELLGRAERLWQDGETIRAVQLYGSIWKQSPNDINSIIIWAGRSADVGNYRWSRNFYAQAEARCGGDPTYLYRIYMGYARTYTKFGYPNYAQKYEEKAADLRASGRVRGVPPRGSTSSGYYEEVEAVPARPRESIAVEPGRPGPSPPPRPAIPTPIAASPVKSVRYLKKRIAVAPIKVVAGNPDLETFGRQIQAMMVTELRKTNRYIVVEREALDDILTEQDLAASGRVAEGSGAETGQLMGAQLMVKAEITDYEDQSSQGRRVGVGPVDWGRGQQVVRVAMDVRVFDTETGVVVASENVSAEKVASDQDFGVSVAIFRWDDAKSQNSTLGFVTRDLIAKALARINAGAEKIPWRASVIKEDEGKVYVNAGVNAAVQKGDHFQVLSTGEALRDPDTGEVLDVATEVAGKIEIMSVQPKYSIGYVTDTPGKIKRGDKVIEIPRSPAPGGAATAEP